MAISRSCLDSGHSIVAYTGTWQGDVPEGLKVVTLPVKGMTNHGRAQSFHRLFIKQIQREHFDLVVGFNKMPDLDVYYAADVCYLARLERERSFLSKLTPRYRLLSMFEKSVFGPESHCKIIHLAESEKRNYQDCYKTLDERFYYGPPGVDVARIRNEKNAKTRMLVRSELGINESHISLLMVGSNYHTKGVHRSIQAIASLPSDLRNRVKLYVVGNGKRAPFIKLAKKNGVEKQVNFMGGRDDVPKFLVACDFLLQPSVNENTGNAIVEAIVAGLPVLSTETCGYSEHVVQADCGLVVQGAFEQQRMNSLLLQLLTSPRKLEWQENCLKYADLVTLDARPQVVKTILEGIAKAKQERY